MKRLIILIIPNAVTRSDIYRTIARCLVDDGGTIEVFSIGRRAALLFPTTRSGSKVTTQFASFFCRGSLRANGSRVVVGETTVGGGGLDDVEQQGDKDYQKSREHCHVEC